jgi:hypothetical protein
VVVVAAVSHGAGNGDLGAGGGKVLKRKEAGDRSNDGSIYRDAEVCRELG